jgi:hypothetical protein
LPDAESASTFPAGSGGTLAVVGDGGVDMRRAVVFVGVVAALVAVGVATPADAITRGGSLDGEAHPYTGIMIAKDADGETLWRCSGALVSPTLYVTAGHCVSEPAVTAEIWFRSDLEPDPEQFGYPDTGEVSGTVHPHTSYDDSIFWAHDLGVVVLDQPMTVSRYASLADQGYVDRMTRGRRTAGATVTAVGYGLQRVIDGNPFDDADVKLQNDKTRYQADLMIVDVRGVGGLGIYNPGQSFMVSGDAKHGGTCFGDSGGPILAGGTDIIVAVNSFGLNGNCAGVGGVYRVDQPDDIDFLSQFVDD